MHVLSSRQCSVCRQMGMRLGTKNRATRTSQRTWLLNSFVCPLTGIESCQPGTNTCLQACQWTCHKIACSFCAAVRCMLSKALSGGDKANSPQQADHGQAACAVGGHCCRQPERSLSNFAALMGLLGLMTQPMPICSLSGIVYAMQCR